MNFNEYGLDSRLVEAVSELGFVEPTPIQHATIPALIEGRDLIGGARTGSGKTAAFGLPLLHLLRDGSDGVGALVLAPTRELALQVCRALEDFAKGLSVRIVSIYGGTPYGGQLAALRKGADVVVGTPGRVLDLADRGALRLDSVRYFVLDEADEMLNMGFLEDIERVMELLPASRQMVLFSATMPAAIRRVAARTLRDPVELSVEDSALEVGHIEQRWMRVPNRHKLDALTRVLAVEPAEATLVFARTRRSCAEVSDELARRGVRVDALHGDLSQGGRERVLARLRSGHLDVVVATDVAARGIDVAHLTHVINFDLPDDVEAYTHRIGRTGRAGRSGVAISFVGPSQKRKMKAFRRTLNVDIPEVEVPSDAAIRARQWDRLERRLRSAGAEMDLEAATNRIASMSLSTEQVAAAALHLLAAGKGFSLDDTEVDHRPPNWSIPRRERATSGAERDVNEVQLFIPMGRDQGLRPGDLVGALANEGGIPGGQIGRVDIKERVSFVGMSREASERVLARLETIDIRGRTAPVMLARPSGRPHGEDSGDRNRRPVPRRDGGRGRPGRPWSARKGQKRHG